MSDGTTIKGIQEIQAANNQVIAALKPQGGLGKALQYALTASHRYAVAITHVWHYKGGALRASHRMELDLPNRIGRISIDPSTINPRGSKPSEYGPIEHARGGEHAFYERTEREAGPRIAAQSQQMFLGWLP